MPDKWEDNKEIQILQEYLRIRSVHSDDNRINYGNLQFEIRLICKQTFRTIELGSLNFSTSF